MSTYRSNQAIVMRGFYTDRQVIKRITKMEREVDSSGKFYFFYDSAPGRVKTAQIPPHITTVAFDQREWVKYKAPDFYNKTFIPGNEETMFIMFQEKEPDFEYYWFVEYDVDYSGNWNEFFSCFRDNDSDLLATTLVRYSELPEWHLWKSLVTPANAVLDDKLKIRAFFPVCRISRRALSFIKTALASGWSGHPEALLASLLYANGYSIEDIGGDGQFVKAWNYNKHYTNNRLDPDLKPGTFVFRPKRRTMGSIPNMLWHPVKRNTIRVWDKKLPVTGRTLMCLRRLYNYTRAR